MMIRAFFAIELPDQTKQTLEKIISVLKKSVKCQDTRWTKPQHLHITLQFLAELNTADIPAILERIHFEIPPFELQLGPIELFPSSHNPRVISLTMEPQETLAQLSATLGNSFSALNYSIETRPFRGHLTLARIKSSNLILPKIKIPIIEPFLVTEVVLFRSEPSDEGSHYTPLERVELSAKKH